MMNTERGFDLPERPESESETGLPPPTGTIFILTLYLVALAGMWGAMYLLMLSR